MGPSLKGKSEELPDYVTAQAQVQSEHMFALIQQSEAQEAKRQVREAGCPKDRRPMMAAKFDRERAEEVLAISRLREEHAFFLSQAIQFGPERRRGVVRTEAAFVADSVGVPGLYADKPRPDYPGTTARELGFLKQAYTKLDAVGSTASQRGEAAARAKQTANANRMMGPSPGFS
jgi:hypothetical protein